MIGRRLPLGEMPKEPGDYMGPCTNYTSGVPAVFFLKPNARDPWDSVGLPRKAVTVDDLALIGAGSGSRISGRVTQTLLQVAQVVDCEPVAVKWRSRALTSARFSEEPKAMARDVTNPTVTCSCGAEAEPYYEEVDIGVGVQRFHAGWECHEHGGLCGVCAACGVADRVGYTHHSWCREHPGEIITPEAFEAVTDALRDRVVERFGEK